MRRLCGLIQRPCSETSPKAILARIASVELSGCRLGRSPYTPPIADLIDEPPVGSPVVPILKGLRKEFASHYASEEKVLKGGGQDPAIIVDLRGRHSRNSASHDQYVSYHNRLEAGGLFFMLPKIWSRRRSGFCALGKAMGCVSGRYCLASSKGTCLGRVPSKTLGFRGLMSSRVSGFRMMTLVQLPQTRVTLFHT